MRQEMSTGCRVGYEIATSGFALLAMTDVWRKEIATSGWRPPRDDLCVISRDDTCMVVRDDGQMAGRFETTKRVRQVRG